MVIAINLFTKNLKINFLIFVFILLAAPLAQAENTTRYSKYFRSEGKLFRVQVIKDLGTWNVVLSLKNKKKALVKTSIPEWLADSFYEYTLELKTVSKRNILLFEARPGEGSNAPNDADIVQIAWLNVGTSWKEIASTRTSILEGSDRLIFRTTTGKNRLIRIRSKETQLFCGATLGVHQEYHLASKTFRSRIDINTLTKHATSLRPKLATSPNRISFPDYTRWVFASSAKDFGEASRTIIRPLRVGDSDPRTYWTEGVAGNGRGEFITAQINNTLKMKGLRIFPGAGTSSEIFNSYDAPKELLISVEDGTRYRIAFPNMTFEELMKNRGFELSFPTPITTSCLSIVILDSQTTTGKHSLGYTAISEIEPITEIDDLSRKEAAHFLVKKMAATTDSRKNRQLALLSGPLKTELIGALENLLKKGDTKTRKRLIPLLRHLPSDASLPLLIELFLSLDVKDPIYRIVKPTLAVHSNVGPILTQVYKNQRPTHEKKLGDLIRLMGRTCHGEGIQTLIPSLGENSNYIRKERILALSRAKVSILPPLFKAAKATINTPAGHDALKAIYAFSKRQYGRDKGVGYGNAIAQIFKNSKRRENRVLILRISTFYDFKDALAFYSDLLTHPDPQIRKYSVRGIAKIENNEARKKLETTLTDPSPDVRIESAKAFLKRKDFLESLTAIQKYAQAEKWPTGIKHACALLTHAQDPKSIRLLENFIMDPSNPKKGWIAAHEFVKSGQSLKVNQIKQLFQDEKTSPRLIGETIDMLGTLRSKASEDFLKNLLHHALLEKNIDEKNREKLYNRTLLALGRHRSKVSSEILFALLSTTQDNKRQSVILRALSFHNSPKVLRKLRQSKGLIQPIVIDNWEDAIQNIQRRIDLHQLENTIEEFKEKTRKDSPVND